jgi:2-C-methyl-D-erythritol 4-phosphate cytidylyltransferase
VSLTRVIGVVLGGGAGQRFGTHRPKQLLALDGKTLVERCVAAFAQAPDVDEVLLVMGPDYVEEGAQLAGDQVLGVVTGGATRAESVRCALRELSQRYDPAATGVLLHDAARPLVTQPVIADCVAALHAGNDAIGTAVPTADTIVIVENGVMAHVPPRETLMRCQTPQGFRLSVINRAHELAAADPDFVPTDDCGVVLRYLPGTPVHVVPGSERNIKVTYPADLAVAEVLLRAPRLWWKRTVAG